MTVEDAQHIAEIVAWFRTAATAKYARGVTEHGGYLPRKGGLLAEAEAECLDLPIYVRTIRQQLARALEELDAGRVERARAILALVLYGAPSDRLA